MAPHTDTGMGRSAEFDGVHSLPVEYTAGELMRAIDRARRKYAASPVHRTLLRIAGIFPAWMGARVAATARPYLAPATRTPTS